MGDDDARPAIRQQLLDADILPIDVDLDGSALQRLPAGARAP